MKILWLARSIPLPLDAGDRIYSANLARFVAAAGASITFMGMKEGQINLEQLSSEVNWLPIGGTKTSMFWFLFSHLPMAGVRFCTPLYKDAIRSALRQQMWDAVVLDQYSMVWALDIVRQFKFEGVIVHVAHDFETKVTQDIVAAFTGNIIKRHMLAINATRTEQAERRLLDQCDLVVTLTDEDKTAFCRFARDKSFVVIPPGYNGRKKEVRTLYKDLPRRVVAVGSFTWIAKQMNLRAFLRIADTQFAANAIELYIIGSIPRHIEADLSKELKATKFLGFVDDLDKVFDEARFGLVFEETGGGFKLKILEYIFNRVPVAGLTQAMSGIPNEIMSHTICANTIEELVILIIKTIDDIDQLNRLQNLAIDAAIGLFDWSSNGRSFIAAVEGVKTRRQGA